jgi:hypothetical protein
VKLVHVAVLPHTEICLCCDALQTNAVMDFGLIEKKVLIAAGVTVTFKGLVLANIR